MHHFFLLSLALLQFCTTCYGIVGGRDAEDHGFPSVASLVIRKFGAYKHACGATIISPTAFLTPASCCQGAADLADLKLLIGTCDRSNGGSYLEARQFTIHPSCDANTFENNFCIVRTDRIPLQAGRVEIAPLPSSEEAAGQPVLALGWGITKLSVPDRAVRLQVAELGIVDRTKCMKDWDGRQRPITAGSLCFQPIEASSTPGSPTCIGDLGGPLLRPADGTLVGVISFDNGCSSTIPNVAGNVLSVVTWIRENSGE